MTFRLITRTIARQPYRNGRWGTNVASLSRVAGGYTVSNGSSDPFFYRSPVAAKAAYRRLVADHI